MPPLPPDEPAKPPDSPPVFNAGTRDEIATVIEEQLEKLMLGASADLQYAAQRIATNATAAAAIGDKEALRECHATAKVLLEQHRLSAVGGSWIAVNAVIGAVIRTMAATLGGFGSGSMSRHGMNAILVAFLMLLPACLQTPNAVSTDNVRDSVTIVLERTERYAAADSAIAPETKDTLAADATSIRTQLGGKYADSRALQGPLGRVCDLHDHYIALDLTLTPLRRSVALESSTQLRALLKPPG